MKARREKFGELEVVITGGSDGRGGGDGPLVVLCHGYGAPGDDLVPLSEMLGATEAVRFAFPAAPLSLAMGWGDARAWWPIDVAKLERALARGEARDLTGDVPDGLRSASAKLVGALDAIEKSLGVPAGKTVLGGFSQGAMISCDVALRTGRPLAGLVLLSGTLLAESEWQPLMGARKGLPVFQSHGRVDPLLPFAVAKRLHELMTTAGLEVEWVPFDGPHAIPPDVLMRLSKWLRGRFLIS